jgi:hypothetical protein
MLDRLVMNDNLIDEGRPVEVTHTSTCSKCKYPNYDRVSRRKR